MRKRVPRRSSPGVLSFIETTLAQTQPPADQAIDINEEVLDDFYLKWLGVPGLSHPGADPVTAQNRRAP